MTRSSLPVSQVIKKLFLQMYI